MLPNATISLCFRVGDEILSVNSEDIFQKSFEDAVDFLEKIPHGRVTMVVKRPRAKPSLMLLDNDSDYVGKTLKSTVKCLMYSVV